MAEAPNKQQIIEAVQNPENNEPAHLYLEDVFQSYVKEKYFIENKEILTNPTLMQMVFALEWYDIPRTSYVDLIEYHPYLTKGDHDKLFYIKTQHRFENLASFLLFSLVSNRHLKSRKNKLLQKRFIRMPLACGIAGILTYAFNSIVLRPIFLHDLGELGLADKYFSLDLNAEMMKDDLKEYGININARHFNLEKTEERLAQQEAKNEVK